MMTKPTGWKKDPARHALAAVGIKTGRRQRYKKGHPESQPAFIEREIKDIMKIQKELGSSGLDALRGQNLLMERSGPGKFEANFNAKLAEALHEMSMEGALDDEAGDVNEQGWAGLLRDLTEYNIKEDSLAVASAILEEDSNGFFTYHTYPTVADGERAWHQVEKELG